MKRYALNSSKFLSPLELANLGALLARQRVSDPRNTLIIDLALNTGARATELLNFRIRDVNHEHQSIFIHGIKGSDDREIPLPEILWQRLEVYLRKVQSQKSYLNRNDSSQNDNGPIFPIGYSRLKAIWAEYRPVSKGFHSLRHTFAINLYEKTRDLRLVKTALGHRNIANTMIYAEYSYSATELRRLIL